MSANKLALMRYKTIDDCLRNKSRKWTLEALIEKVSDTLYETEGITSGVSKRTIQADIQVMRSDKLGYNAPIIIKEKKFYVYSEPGYSIMNGPINKADAEKMKEIVSLLKQFNGFSFFTEMAEMITRLESNLHKSTHQSSTLIQFESNKLLKGLEHINSLYQAIFNKRSLLIEYKSFKAAEPRQYTCYPYLLKEYNNRWFLICGEKKKRFLFTMALDRIIALQELPKERFVDYTGVDFDTYYGDVLGVTKTEKDRAQKVILFVDKQHAPYILTKPIHHTQQVLKAGEEGTILRIDVVTNFELEKEILGFGEFVKVLSPRLLASKIKARLNKTMQGYEIG